MNLLQQQECELTIATPEIQQEIIEPSTDFNPVGFAILPSKELPTESLTTIQQTSNISSLHGPHTPAYTQPMKHFTAAHTDVYRSVTPSEELPTESLTTIQPASTISSLPGPHTTAYTQPMKHITAAHTDVYRPVVEAITPVKKGSASKVKKIRLQKASFFPLSLPTSISRSH